MLRKVARFAIRKFRFALRKFGYDIYPTHGRRDDPIEDIQSLSPDRPIIFDVGANLGQTIAELRTACPDAIIHAFEPGAAAFETLQRTWGGTSDVTLNNFALGSEEAKRSFNEMLQHDMSSFLPTGKHGWGLITNRREVSIKTVDGYCAANGIAQIDVLKCDTQGFDLEVLRGAQQMMARDAIRVVYVEINFAELYVGQAAADEIMSFLRLNGFELVTFYRFHNVDYRIGWTDALFRMPPERPSRLAARSRVPAGWVAIWLICAAGDA